MLNEKIEAHEQMRAPNNNYILEQHSSETQTDGIYATHLIPKANACTQTIECKSNTPSSTKPSSAIPRKSSPAPAKDDSQLLSAMRSMRVDLAIKDKTMQRLTRELDECKKIIKKLQRELNGIYIILIQLNFSINCNVHYKYIDRPMNGKGKQYDPSQFESSDSDSSLLQDSLKRINMLESDYKALHEKRLQDVSKYKLEINEMIYIPTSNDIVENASVGS